jgi:hypothetical protein
MPRSRPHAMRVANGQARAVSLDPFLGCACSRWWCADEAYRTQVRVRGELIVDRPFRFIARCTGDSTFDAYLLFGGSRRFHYSPLKVYEGIACGATHHGGRCRESHRDPERWRERPIVRQWRYGGPRSRRCVAHPRCEPSRIIGSTDTRNGCEGRVLGYEASCSAGSLRRDLGVCAPTSLDSEQECVCFM